VASCLFDRDSGGQLRWTRLDVVRPVRDAFAVSRHLLSGLEKGVSGLLFAPKRLLARRCLEIRLGLGTAKTSCSNARAKTGII